MSMRMGVRFIVTDLLYSWHDLGHACMPGCGVYEADEIEWV